MTATDEARQVEINKYRTLYTRDTSYRMGGQRCLEAKDDLAWAHRHGARSYLDVGCGAGEMIDHAMATGFEMAIGAEAVPELCTKPEIYNLTVRDLGAFPDGQFDLVSSFDVIEHLLPGDDSHLLSELGRIASKRIVVTANNMPSVDPKTGADLHINIRPYDDWQAMLHDILEPMGWIIGRQLDKQYVSATWRAWLP